MCIYNICDIYIYTYYIVYTCMCVHVCSLKETLWTKER